MLSHKLKCILTRKTHTVIRCVGRHQHHPHRRRHRHRCYQFTLWLWLYFYHTIFLSTDLNTPIEAIEWEKIGNQFDSSVSNVIFLRKFLMRRIKTSIGINLLVQTFSATNRNTLPLLLLDGKTK